MKPTFLSAASEQARVAQLFTHVRDGVVMIDPAGTVGFWSVGAEEIYGHPAPEALNRCYLDLLPARCRAIQVKHINRALEGEETAAEWQTTGRNGRPVWLEASFRPMHDDMGLLIGCAILLHDVTKWKASEAARQASDELLRTITDNMPGVVFQYQLWPNGRRAFPFVSRGVEELLERSVAEMNNPVNGGETLFLPEDQDRFRTSLEASRTTLEPWDGEFRVRTARTGKVKWVRVRATPSRLPDGGTLWDGVMTDVTEQAATLAALQESEERYRRLFEDSSIGIYRTTPDGRFLIANPAAVRMNGYNSFEELAAVNLESDRTRAVYDRSEFKRLIEEAGEVCGLEAVWRTNGEVIYVRENSRAIRDENGTILYYEGTLEDITDRRKAEQALQEHEELLRNVITHIPGAVFWKDRRSVYLGCNEFVARNCGFESPEELIGLTDFDLGFEPAEAESYREFDRKVMESGTPIINLEETQTRKDGKATLLTSKVPLRDKSGQVVGILGLYQDITDRKRLEEKAREGQKMEAVGRLAGGVAHDFNNLLTVINGFSEMALRGINRPDAARLTAQLNEIRKAGERASDLTRQLLAFGRRQIQTRTRANLNDVVETTRRLVGRVLGEHIRIETKLDPELGLVHTDVGQLEQVLMNLVLNSRDAMPDGGTVTISTGNVSFQHSPDGEVQPGNYVMLAITDTGCGMDARTRAHAFEPFFTTKELGKGTGLGLATVFGIVKQGGGHVAIDSEPGRGTAVRVYLPRHEPVADVSRSNMAESAMTGRETVLLVEDDDSVRSVTGAMLRAMGYRVIEASGGLEAVKRCRETPGSIDLLLTDVVMPTMSGREVACRIRELVPRLRTLFMSGYTDDSILRHGVLDEGVAFVGKPFSHEALGRKVREVLCAPASF